MIERETSGGLLVGGALVPVAGLVIIPPASHDGPAWARLEARDFRTRRTSWVRQIVIHTTMGIDPQTILAGAGAGGRDKQTADYWHSTAEGKAKSSAAPLVVDNDGSVACLCDLADHEAYHATVSNPWSIGIEMYQEHAPIRGAIYEAVLESTVRLVLALCAEFQIPLQIPSPYQGGPRNRLRHDGGPDVVGVIGHRDNTNQRGRGDPGDEIFNRLALAGAEVIDFDRHDDITRWRRRQTVLNELGAELVLDGIAGPKTIGAMRARGLAHGREIDQLGG